MSIHSSEPQRKWISASADHPCPICRKPDWCSVNRDGTTAICRRGNNGTGKEKADKSGGTYWLYRLDGKSVTKGLLHNNLNDAAPESEMREPPRADASVLNTVYLALLEELTLSPEHQAD